MSACQTPAAPATAAASPKKSTWSEHQAQALKSLGFVQNGEEWTLNLATSLLFSFDSDRLQQAQLKQLSELGQQLRELEVPSLRIEGHSDALGEAAYNKQLSQRRANAVAQALQSAGWPASALKILGFGREKPIADNASEAGRAQNRRVVLIAMAD
ncbi:OmpA family protein [Paucibacter sp. Y2R2-4]|uniref:OmpA family protein n=1 Tax=Paucibacter sp. Y2R2-4 TaxID=2893553 RepID=UPI0021E3623E|nr:OmpA family protein [Paucibacter sp. Y2R2-4]MCV2352463.1 OmpA family protein [Paucibacter sp. Y2R2-4]